MTHQALENIPGVQWFHHGERVLQLLEELRPITIVELGTYQAGSAIAMARVAKQWGGNITSYGIDDDPNIAAEARRNITDCGLDAWISFIEKPSMIGALMWWPETLIDFLYIDADHTEESVLTDLVSWYPLLRKGAIYLGDDYDNPMFPGVTQAWDKWEKFGHDLQREEPNPHSVPPGMRLIYGWK